MSDIFNKREGKGVNGRNRNALVSIFSKECCKTTRKPFRVLVQNHLICNSPRHKGTKIGQQIGRSVVCCPSELTGSVK